jgi:hypothetical protein
MFVFDHNKASYSWLSFHYMGALQPLPHSYKNSEREVISKPNPVVTYSDAERERERQDPICCKVHRDSHGREDCDALLYAEE